MQSRTHYKVSVVFSIIKAHWMTWCVLFFWTLADICEVRNVETKAMKNKGKKTDITY